MTHTFIFQIHNRESSVAQLLTPFVEAQMNGFDSQLIVCNDGSTDNTYTEIMNVLNRNKAVCNTVMTLFDTYEVPLTWRAMQFAEGRIISWIQDDDFYESMEFASKAEEIFSKRPEIAVLSPKHGYFFHPKSLDLRLSYGELRSTDFNPHVVPEYDEDGVMIVQATDRAPFIFRKDYYDEVGGVDPVFRIGGYTENDLCLRWARIGKKTGIYHSDSYKYNYWSPGSLMSGSKAMSEFVFNKARCLSKNMDML